MLFPWIDKIEDFPIERTKKSRCRVESKIICRDDTEIYIKSDGTITKIIDYERRGWHPPRQKRSK